MLENVHGRRRRYHNCFEKRCNHSASPRRDIGPCGEVYKPALSAWNRFLTSQGTKMAYIFRKNQAELDRVPPTQGALYEAILRSHYQMIVWNNDKVCCASLPQPDEFGWEKREDECVPVMTKEVPAPEAIVQLVKCGCQKNRFSNNRCHCRKSGLNCTYLCSFCDSDDHCEKCM